MLLQTCLETWAQAQLKRAEGVRLPENWEAVTRCMLRPVYHPTAATYVALSPLMI